MKKLSRTGNHAFESLQQLKFRTLEASELEHMHGGHGAVTMTLATVTVTQSGSHTDSGDKGEAAV